jgi:adenylylsulfate kinase-like enzyme
VREATCVLLTGRAGAGKTTIGRGVADELRRRGRSCGVLDAAAVERHLRPGVDSVVWCCALLVGGGAHVVVTAPVPTRAAREQLRDAIPTLVELFLDAPAALCAQRSGGTDEEFEEPYAADLRVPTHDRDPAASIAQSVSFLETIGVAPRDPVHPSERQP